MEAQADHAAAAGHRLLLCADEPGPHRRGSAAAGVHPHGPRPDQGQARHTPSSGWQDDHQPAAGPDHHTCQVSVRDTLGLSLSPGTDPSGSGDESASF